MIFSLNLLLLINSFLTVDAPVTTKEYCELIGSVDEVRHRIPTLNQYGSNYCFNTELTDAFLEYCRKAHPAHALEVGAAFGIKSQQIVQTNTQLAINDLETRHLEIIQKAFQTLSNKNSLFLNASFHPGSYLNLKLPSLYNAILIESVIHFLTPDETTAVAEKLYQDLEPQGRVFIMVSSPFLKIVHEIYEKRKRENDPWPGFFPDPEEVDLLLARLHKPYHFFDHETLCNVFLKAGFKIIEARYIALPHKEYDLKWDGREGLMIIAEKSGSSLSSTDSIPKETEPYYNQ